jgi:maltose O-acetyltransferase
MKTLAELLHLKGLRYKFNLYLVNKVYAGTKEKHFEKKRKLLNAIGFDIGEGTKIVAPFYCLGKVKIGKNCWIGKNFFVNGNGNVTIGDNCDIAPEVIFQTGGHKIGDKSRRAGEGLVFNQTVGDGCWIGGRVTIINNTNIGNSCVIGACALVNKDVPDNSLVVGVPAKIIKTLE